MFTEIVELLHRIYEVVGLAGTAAAAIVLVSGSLALATLVRFVRGERRYAVLFATTSVMVLSGWLFHDLQHRQAAVAARILDGRWHIAETSCSEPMTYAVSEQAFGETDLVVTTAMLPDRFSIDMLQSDSTRGVIVVHRIIDKTTTTYRREGRDLLMAADNQQEIRLYPCE